LKKCGKELKEKKVYEVLSKEFPFEYIDSEEGLRDLIRHFK
jgi:hypothetical protein